MATSLLSICVTGMKEILETMSRQVMALTIGTMEMFTVEDTRMILSMELESTHGPVESGLNTMENGLMVNSMAMEDCPTKIRVSTLEIGRIVKEKDGA